MLLRVHTKVLEPLTFSLYQLSPSVCNEQIHGYADFIIYTFVNSLLVNPNTSYHIHDIVLWYWPVNSDVFH